MAELVFFRQGEELLRVALRDRTEIGRAPECDIALPDPSVSRVQAVIERQGSEYLLTDRSGRGTRVGNALVAEATLVDGLELGFGGLRAVFNVVGAEQTGETRVTGDTVARPRSGEHGARPARLRVRRSGTEQVYPLGSTRLTIGKDSSNDVVLDDHFVSSRHARLEPRDGGWYLVDLGSTNGTLLSGASITHGEVMPGAVITVGDTELVLELDGEEPLPLNGESTFEGMYSRDPGMRQAFEVIERVAPTEATVMIMGETGTGKELVARALHARSGREGVFIPVNCSAITESLIESELFGHEKGAFSGADRLRKGAFEEADGGTLFLDEIGELPLEQQAKLLRVLEEGEVRRVGATRPIRVSTRIVAATHRDLRAQVRAKKFREDLFYRITVIPVQLPPLRSRRGDIGTLARVFLARAAPAGRKVEWAPDALAKLEGYDWPGNIRQLKNVVQRALLLRGAGAPLGADSVMFEDTRAITGPSFDDDTLYVRGLTFEQGQRELLRLSLRRNRGNRTAVVKELQIARSSVMKWITQWGLKDEGRDGLEPGEGDVEDDGADED
jgi:DNA-binding NtrC family response regulator